MTELQWQHRANTERGAVGSRSKGGRVDLAGGQPSYGDSTARASDRFRLLVENSTDVITRVTPDGALVDVSSSSSRLCGYDPSELVGRNVEHFIHAADLAQLRGELPADPTRADTRTVEHRVRRKDGSYVWVESSIRRFRDRLTGKTVEFQGATRDISERPAGAGGAGEAEAQLHAAFASAAIGMCLVKVSGRFLRINQAFCGLMGYSEDELLQRTFADLTHPDDLAASRAALKQIAAGVRATAELEKRYLTRDGSTVWAHTSLSAVAPAAGHQAYLIVQVQDVSERKRAHDALRHAADHDGLTGLANRRHLLRTYAGGSRRRGLGVVLIDLDRFKAVNDTYGHAAGDQVLRVIADRLRPLVRDGDLLARLGGDEFLIVVAGGAQTDAQVIGDRAAGAIRRPIPVAGIDITVDCSVGVAIAEGDRPLADLMTDADACMYSIKNNGGAHRVGVFDPGVHGEVLEQLAISAELRGALARDEFVVHYQPIVDLRSRTILGFEALVRWEHPVRGMIPPLEFIPIAEQTGLMLDLGDWVLAEACRTARGWQNGSGEGPYVTVNLSVRQLEDARFLERFHKTLSASGLDPRRLIVEVTETLLMTALSRVSSPLEQLRESGVRVYLDDFGTGYSSLGQIRHLPLDGVKLDRLFSADLTTSDDSWSIGGAIVKLLDRLNLTLIAEGVESSADLAQLRSLGCYHGQGYYFARPRPAGALDGLPGDRQEASG